MRPIRTDHIVSLQNKFYIIEINNKTEEALDSVYSLPNKDYEKLNLLSKYILIEPPDGIKNNRLCLYSSESNTMIEFDSSYNNILEYYFNVSKSSENSIIHFGLIIPSSSLTYGKQKPSIKEYILSDEVGYCTFEEITLMPERLKEINIKDIMDILTDIRNNKYRKYSLFHKFLRFFIK